MHPCSIKVLIYLQKQLNLTDPSLSTDPFQKIHGLNFENPIHNGIKID